MKISRLQDSKNEIVLGAVGIKVRNSRVSLRLPGRLVLVDPHLLLSRFSALFVIFDLADLAKKLDKPAPQSTVLLLSSRRGSQALTCTEKTYRKTSYGRKCGASSTCMLFLCFACSEPTTVPPIE